MKIELDFQHGVAPSDKALIVMLRDARGFRGWSYLPEGATQPEIENAFVSIYDFQGSSEAIECEATIRKDDTIIGHWSFVIQPQLEPW